MLLISLAFAFFNGIQVFGHLDCQLNVARQSDTKLYRSLQWLEPNVSTEQDTIPSGSFVDVSCDTGFLQNQLIAKTYTIQCTDGFFNGSQRYDDFLCRSRQQENTTIYRRSVSDATMGILKCSGRKLEAYDVGHILPRGCVKIVYSVCTDRGDLSTKFVYQKEVWPPEWNANRVGCQRGVWGFDGFGVTVGDKKVLSRAYIKSHQNRRLTALFPGRYNRRKPYPFYFNRGHLAPSGDFPECEKSATYEYINLAPQWNILNGGSWNLIEREAREIVNGSNLDWEIYTGTYGKIPTPNGLMYLITVNDKTSSRGYVPVPMLYWKIVYNKVDWAKSYVYIGVNNPEFKSFDEIRDTYILCTPIRNNESKYYIGSEFMGFVYQCRLDEFLQRISKEGIVRDDLDLISEHET